MTIDLYEHKKESQGAGRRFFFNNQRPLYSGHRLLLFYIFLILSAGYLLFMNPAEASEVIGKLNYVQGKVDIMRGGALPALPAKVSDGIFLKDVIRTKSDSKAEIIFNDGNILRLAQRSRVDISEYVAEDAKGTRVISLPRGKVEAVVPAKLAKQIETSPKANRFEIHTPNAVAGVRGTDYIIFYENNNTYVLVMDGIVNIFNPVYPSVVVALTAGQISRVPSNKPAEPPRNATKDEKTRHERDTAPLKTKGKVDSGGAEAQGIETKGDEKSEIGREIVTYLSEHPDTTKGLGAAGFEGGSGSLGNLTILSIDKITSPPPPPVVEVGRTTLSGSLVLGPSTQFDYMSVIMKDVIFFSPSVGSRPSTWKTDSINGTYSFGSYLSGGNNSIPISNGQGITGNFNINQWGNSGWSGSVNGAGTLGGGSYSGPVTFSGSGSGAVTGTTSGSFSGAGSGSAH